MAITKRLWVLHCLDNEHEFTSEARALAVAAAYLIVSPNAPRLWRVDLTIRPSQPSPLSRCVVWVQAGEAVEVELTGKVI